MNPNTYRAIRRAEMASSSTPDQDAIIELTDKLYKALDAVADLRDALRMTPIVDNPKPSTEDVDELLRDVGNYAADIEYLLTITP